MRFGMLGPLRVDTGLGWVTVPAEQQRVVLAVLLTVPGRVVATQRLVDEVWGGRPPRTAVNTVQAYVMRLRRLIGDGVLLTRRHGYELVVGRDDVDAAVFERLVASGRDALAGGRPDAAAARLSEALALWRGPALADVPASASLTAWAAHLEQVRLAVVEDHMAALLELDRHSEVVDDLHRLVGEHPLRERLWAQLMLALHRCGRRAEALDAYQRARRVMVAELGLEPGPQLRELQETVLAEDRAEARASQPALPWVVPAQLPADVPGFTGRDDQLAQLDTLLPGTGDPAGTAVAISAIAGAAGVGKTALAVHWGHRVRDWFADGQLYVNLRGHATDAPMRPIEALARLLRALDMSAVPSDVDEAAARYRSLMAGKRMLVLLDDARDPDQVRPLLPGSPGCMALVTSRDRLAGLVARDGAAPMVLDVLSDAETHALLARLLGADRVRAEPTAAAELARLCGNQPFAVRIAAANLATHPRTSIAEYATRLSGDRPEWLQTDDDGHRPRSTRPTLPCPHR
jgi:DNA-binding SARP family transcriptional activator